MAGKEVAKTTKKAPVKTQEDIFEIEGVDLVADAAGGMEGTDRESFAIPFLRVIQKTSPQVDPADPGYMKEARAGMIINTVTNKLYEEVTFLPCAYQRRFIQWGARGSDNDGYKGELLPDDVAAKRDEGEINEIDGKLYLGDTEKCDTIQDTRNHYGLLLEGGRASQILLSLTSTQIKKSKQLMSMLSEAKIKTKKGLITPPTWMVKVKITTVPEKNDQGSWFGVRFELDGYNTDAGLYAVGKAFHDQVVAGDANVNYGHDEEKGSNGKF